MTIVLNMLLIITYIAATALGIGHYTHMFQLSSYQFQGYFRFLKTVRDRIFLHLAVNLTIVVTGTAYAGDITGGTFIVLSIISIVLLCGMMHMYWPRPAKKKFVVTNRVKRLFITYCLIALLLMGFTYAALPVNNGRLIIRCIWGFQIGFMPIVVVIAGLINLPIEKRINKYYVDDAKKMLRDHGRLRVIGVTGSYGKTSVKYYLTTLLSEGFRVLMTPESYNTPMGIVRTIREHLQPTHEIFVCEMGARHLHDIKEITDIVHPDDGILTSIGYQHLETFHSLENIISTKYELLDAVDEKMKQGGVADAEKHLKFVNGDNEIIRNNMKYSDAITYGLSEGCDFRASDIKVTSAGTTFTVTAPSGEKTEFNTKLVGAHNVENIVGAIAVANSFGIPMGKLKAGVRRIQSVPHRLELVKHGRVTILDDAYNSNPNGAQVAVETLGLFEDKVKILVTPGMVELGEKEDEYNTIFGSQAAKVCDYIILVGEKNSESIKKGALDAGFDPERLFVKHTLQEATQLMYELDAGREKVILLENDLPDNYK
ncbi:MAG: UDP-N-acetylmuramoyl-tripeptide--D-alanyl-D-alanine ligase [Butyrivibrio sp.]|nr:UDP-N-acetylmuramoyl-tripeptide--D-alanyl-D-alanine ligase [Butyrivibrio sp.]